MLRLAGERAQKKVQHWRAVAAAACEQSGRTVLPVVAPVRTLPEWLAGLPNGRLVALPGHPQFPWLDEPGRFVTALDHFLSVTRPLLNRAGK